MMDVNYKEKVIYAWRKWKKNERHNSLFFYACSLTPVYYGVHSVSDDWSYIFTVHCCCVEHPEFCCTLMYNDNKVYSF